ncbi:hypothetical protein C0995_014044, partial [Termitomyces sp. Mi166
MVFQPHEPDMYGQYHMSKLMWSTENDSELFSSQELEEPSPVSASDTGLKEHFVEKIIDSRQKGHRWQYLVHFWGYGPEHDECKSGHELSNNKALNIWLAENDDGLT